MRWRLPTKAVGCGNPPATVQRNQPTMCGESGRSLLLESHLTRYEKLSLTGIARTDGSVKYRTSSLCSRLLHVQPCGCLQNVSSNQAVSCATGDTTCPCKYAGASFNVGHLPMRLNLAAVPVGLFLQICLVGSLALVTQLVCRLYFLRTASHPFLRTFSSNPAVKRAPPQHHLVHGSREVVS